MTSGWLGAILCKLGRHDWESVGLMTHGCSRCDRSEPAWKFNLGWLDK